MERNGSAGEPSYPFNTAYTNFFDDVLYKTAFWNDGTLSNNALFEFDSRCPNSTYIPQIKAELDKQTNSLLLRENCTWAFWDSKRKLKRSKKKTAIFSGPLLTRTRSAPESRSPCSSRPVTGNTMSPKLRPANEPTAWVKNMSQLQNISKQRMRSKRS